jgi:hypothetical protein
LTPKPTGKLGSFMYRKFGNIDRGTWATLQKVLVTA